MWLILTMLSKTRLLFSAIAIEGYAVLACELLAIRQLVPFVGSGIETTSIIIGGVLMPLAVGYYFGGSLLSRRRRARQRNGGRQTTFSIRRTLVRNVVSAMAFLGLGLPSPLLEIYFFQMQESGITHRLLQTLFYVAVFVVPPMFLLGQTVPLVSNCFSRRRISEITGRMLFFSTIGAFLGSIFSTIVLMTFLGVNNTISITISLLFLLCLMMGWRGQKDSLLVGAAIVAFTLLFNSEKMMQIGQVVADNAYNRVQILELPEQRSRIMLVNRSPSSKLSEDPNIQFEYVKYINRTFIEPIAKPSGASAPKDVLVIGAGGFTIGKEDLFNNYAFVDIDEALREVAEESFLKQKLPPNKRFFPASARAFLNADKGKYDLIVVDVYTMRISIPMECVTREFFAAVKKRLKPGGIVVANAVAMPSPRDKFSARYNNTFASVFPSYTRQIIGDFDPWEKSLDDVQNRNVLYVYFDAPYADDAVVYTDNRNSYSLDRP